MRAGRGEGVDNFRGPEYVPADAPQIGRQSPASVLYPIAVPVLQNGHWDRLCRPVQERD